MTTGPRRSALLLTAVLLAALVQPAAWAATGQPSSGTDPVVAEDRSLLELAAEGHAIKAHNDQRAAGNSRGGTSHDDVDSGPPLVPYTDMMTVSRRWADRIDFTRFRHNPDFGDQYGHWRRAAENIAIGTIKRADLGRPSRSEVLAETEDLLQAWWNSEGHRRNWMRDSWDHVSVGAAIRVTSVDGRDHWTLALVANFREHDGSRIAASPFAADGSAPPNESSHPSADSPSAMPSDAAVALAGDWDGDGDEDLGWYDAGRVVLRNGDGSTHAFTYGRPGDVPIVGDWDGDGVDTVSVIRDRVWHLNNRHGGGDAHRSFVYGRLTGGDQPLVGDWDGDGRDGVGIVRDGEWHLRNRQSGGPGTTVFVYGRVLQGDVPIIGDWNGDGRDTVGIVRDGEWHLRDALAPGAADRVVTFGRASDLPVAADFDGDGRTTTGAVRGDRWYLRNDLRGGGAQVTLRFGT